MKPQYADIEYKDGTLVEGIRIGLTAKLQYERTARAKKWKQDDSSFTTTAYLAWAAARAEGRPHTPETWDDFLCDVLDVFMYIEEPEPADDDVVDDDLGDLPDPTHQAATTD